MTDASDLPHPPGTPRPSQRESQPAPPFNPGEEWAGRCWVRLRESPDPVISQLVQAARLARPVVIRYWGGSAGLGPRPILPALVFADEDCLAYAGAVAYCLAWCAKREAPRLFRSDRIEDLIEEPGPVEGFPYHRALAEIETEIRSRFQVDGEEVTILLPGS